MLRLYVQIVAFASCFYAEIPSVSDTDGSSNARNRQYTGTSATRGIALLAVKGVFMKSSFIRTRLHAAIVLAALLAMAAVFVIIMGCQDKVVLQITSVKVEASGQAIAKGVAAPAFTLTDSAGKTATLADYKGKVVLLDFWATWW